MRFKIINFPKEINHPLSDKGLQGTVVNQICQPVNEGSLETMSTILLKI